MNNIRKIPWKPTIDKDNEMDPKILKVFSENIEDAKPVIELNDKIAPIYMFIAIVAMKSPLGEIIVNFMTTILHNKKEKKLEIRGRARFETTKKKMIFEHKKKYSLDEIPKAKTIIKEMYNTMVKDLSLTEKETPYELEFEIDEDTTSIVQKMNNSNQFDIGIVDINKKKK